jgi:uncharacterized protein (TIGR00303 family)
MQTINTSNPLLFSGKKADFLLAASVTHTCDINNITQAGIPGKIHLTPTLDAEFITTAKVFSLEGIAETPKGVPTPALITRAVEQLCPFSCIKTLDLGLEVTPQNCDILEFDISPSQSISTPKTGAAIDAQTLFNKGLEAGRDYQAQGEYIILGESTPAGTTTALASIVCLGYDELKEAFSSSFADAPYSLKAIVLDQANRNVLVEMNTIERLSLIADNMLLFCAGFVLEASQHTPIVLAGGTQMAAVLLIADNLAAEQDIEFYPENIHLATTSWVRNDVDSDVVQILENLSFEITSYFADFTFSESTHPALKLYDEGEAKEGVGAGAALCYALSNGITEEQIIQEVEKFLV